MPEQRKSRHERGYTAKWQAFRWQFLAANPWCKCGKRATVVDHIRPHKGDQALFWDRYNLQPMCVTCHNRKTALYDGGFGQRGNIMTC